MIVTIYLVIILCIIPFVIKTKAIKKITKEELLQIVLICLGSILLITMLMFLEQTLGHVNIKTYEDSMKNLYVYKTNYWYLLATVLEAAIFEELIFRFAAFKIMEQIFKTVPYQKQFNIICIAVLFGCLHGVTEQKWYAFICGVILGCLYYYRYDMTQKVLIEDSNVLRPIAFHLIFNFIGWASMLVVS